MIKINRKMQIASLILLYVSLLGILRLTSQDRVETNSTSEEVSVNESSNTNNEEGENNAVLGALEGEDADLPFSADAGSNDVSEEPEDQEDSNSDEEDSNTEDVGEGENEEENNDAEEDSEEEKPDSRENPLETFREMNELTQKTNQITLFVEKPDEASVEVSDIFVSSLVNFYGEETLTNLLRDFESITFIDWEVDGTEGVATARVVQDGETQLYNAHFYLINDDWYLYKTEEL